MRSPEQEARLSKIDRHLYDAMNIAGVTNEEFVSSVCGCLAGFIRSRPDEVKIMQAEIMVQALLECALDISVVVQITPCLEVGHA